MAGFQQGRIARVPGLRQSKKLMRGIKEIYPGGLFLERGRYCMPRPCPGISRMITPSAVSTAIK
jgi:hypothetical protein